MPPPPPSPLLFRSSLHPVRGAPLFSLSRQPAVNALSLSCQNASIPLSLSCSPASLQHLPLSRPLSTTLSCHSGDHHGVHYDPPQGWLFGIPPGQKYEKEGWEGLWVWGFWGSLIFGVVGYAYKPDTSIQTWALEEARRRLEIEGILEDPYPPSPLPSATEADGEVKGGS